MALITRGNQDYLGGTVSGSLIVVGDISAAKFVGDGTLLTGVLVSACSITNDQLETDIKVGSLSLYQGDRNENVTAALNEQMILRSHDKFTGSAFSQADTNSLAAIHGVEIYGSDSSSPHQIWRIYRSSSTQGYRVVLGRRSGSAWERFIDTDSMVGVVTENASGITSVTVPAANNVLGTASTAWAKLWIDYSKVCTPGYDYCSLGGNASTMADPPYVIKASNIFELPNTISASSYVSAINEVLEDVDSTVDMYRMSKYEALYAGTTYKRGIVALRFDDGRVQDYDVVYPLLLAKNLVGSFAISSSLINTASYMTTAQVLEMQQNGMEFMCHSATHGSNPGSYAEFVTETVTAASELIAGSVCINQFIQPGTWTGNYNFTTESQFMSREGRAIRNSFAAMSAYSSSPESHEVSYHYGLPRRYRYGQAGHSGYSASLSALQTYVDTCSRYGMSYCSLFHPSNFDTAGNIAASDFSTFVDYVASARDAGKIDVMTLTAQFYAQPSPSKINLLGDGDFELSATDDLMFWHVYTGSPQIVASGISGNCAMVDSTDYIAQYIGGKNLRSLAVDYWAKSAGSTSTCARVVIQGNNASMLNISDEIEVSTSAWEHGFFNLGVRPDNSYIRLRLLGTNACIPVFFDNVQVYKT